MASTFGDGQSYSKLPPIRKGSLKNSQDLHEGKEDSSQAIDFNRDGHGLVRLPPIIRVESLLSSPNTTKQTGTHPEESKGNVWSENQDSDNTRFSSNLSFKQKTHSSHSDIHLDKSRRKIVEDAARDSHENIEDLHLVKSEPGSHSRFDTFGEQNLDEIKAPSLLSSGQVEQGVRRASLVTTEPQRLHRGRRLAKSSPNLSSTRKKYSSPIRDPKGRTDIDSIASRSPSDSKYSELLRFDISANILSTDQGSPRSPRTGKARGLSRKAESKHYFNIKGESSAHSNPCTPVVQLIGDENDHLSSREERKSLGDINNIIAPLRGKKTSIVSTGKKLPIRDEIKKDTLRVDGKTCPKNERLTARIGSPRPHPSRDGFLRPPESKAKRDSLYDLQQILAMLNKEDRSVNPNLRENRSSSVYNLQEFLGMSSFPEPGAIFTKQNKSLNPQNLETIESLAVPCNVEPENRRGSTYDLLEFLSLNFAAKSKDNERGSDAASPVVNFSRTTNSPAFLTPKDSENATADLRRPSAYDLMEFLSLSRNNQNEEGKTNASTEQPSLKLPTKVSNEQAESRKNSVYNLEEFLGLSKSLPTVSRTSEASETPVPNAPFLSPNLPTNFKFKRDSIYDLQEFLGILQKEADVKRSVSQPEEKDYSKASVVSPGIDRKDEAKESTTVRQESLNSEPRGKNRSLSIYDLKEFLSIYGSQSGQPSTGIQNRRKASGISQSSIMINVSEDEFGNGSVEDVFLAVPVEGTLGRKRSSVSELNELINILNDPSRKRVYSNPSSAKSNSENSSGGPPSPVSRHDSGGTKSLYDLGEFLSMLNSDDSPLRRRLSSVSDRGNCTPSGLSRNDSSGGSSLYDLEEFLTILNDNSKEEPESTKENSTQEICIPVPQLPSRSERNGNERITLMKRRSLTTQCTGMNSVPESSELVSKQNDGRRASLGHIL